METGVKIEEGGQSPIRLSYENQRYLEKTVGIETQPIEDLLNQRGEKRVGPILADETLSSEVKEEALRRISFQMNEGVRLCLEHSWPDGIIREQEDDWGRKIKDWVPEAKAAKADLMWGYFATAIRLGNHPSHAIQALRQFAKLEERTPLIVIGEQIPTIAQGRKAAEQRFPNDRNPLDVLDKEMGKEGFVWSSGEIYIPVEKTA